MSVEEEHFVSEPWLIDNDYPLHVAATEGWADVLQLLIDDGRSVNHINFDSVTPLHEACLAGHAQCARTLLEAGANVNASNVDGATPLCDASICGSVECVRLLLDCGALVNPELNFTSPLHEAVLQNRLAVIDLLLEVDASLTSNDLHFGTPLHVAAFKNHVEAGTMLLRAGANVNATKTHQTALHVAATNGSVEMVMLLLEFGANVYHENQRGRRASDMVASKSPLCWLLKIHEGNPSALMHQCRLTIRRTMSPRTLLHLPDLSLPRYLHKFLDHRLPAQDNR